MQRTDTKDWHQQPLVWMLIAIPFSAVIMGVLMIYLAITTNDGLVVDDYYKKGKEINLDLARDKAALTYQLSAELNFNFNKKILITKFYKGALPKAPVSLTLSLYHATRQGFDKTLQLQRTPEGNYYSALPELVQGRWYIVLADNDWRLGSSHVMPDSVTLILGSQK